MSIYEKLLAIQTSLKAPKNQYNKFGEYYYRNLEDVLEAAKPILKRQKVTLIISDEIDKIESEKDQILDALEKEFDEKLSEENIAQMVQKALTSGFIELNGKMQSIQSLLLDTINESADGYSVMADVIKNELVTNLNIALDTMKELQNINDTLGLQSYDIANSVSTKSIDMPGYNKGSKAISIGDTNITITGSVDEVTLAKIEEMIQDSQDRMLNEITANL